MVPLALALETGEAPTGFYWGRAGRRALYRFWQEAGADPLFQGAAPEGLDFEALCEVRALAASPLFGGPAREIQRWQIERVAASRSRLSGPEAR